MVLLAIKPSFPTSESCLLAVAFSSSSYHWVAYGCVPEGIPRWRWKVAFGFYESKESKEGWGKNRSSEWSNFKILVSAFLSIKFDLPLTYLLNKSIFNFSFCLFGVVRKQKQNFTLPSLYYMIDSKKMENNQFWHYSLFIYFHMFIHRICSGDRLYLENIFFFRKVISVVCFLKNSECLCLHVCGRTWLWYNSPPNHLDVIWLLLSFSISEKKSAYVDLCQLILQQFRSFPIHILQKVFCQMSTYNSKKKSEYV